MRSINRVSKYRQPMRGPKMKITGTMLVMLLLFGMAMGYIMGLWQQVAQIRNREILQTCTGWEE